MNIKPIMLWLLAGVLALARPLQAQEPDTTEVLRSLDELLNIKISTAAKYEQTVSEAPASVTIITAEEIHAYGFETLEDVFKSVRGFYTSYDRNYSYVGVRGYSRPTDYNNRILLLINGNATNESYYGAAAAGAEAGLNLDAVERIEIVRGPGSALYGTYALFAVINVITKPGKAIDGLELNAATGSYGKSRLAGQFGREFANGVDLIISGAWADIAGQDLYYREYDDPATNNGVAENLDGEEYFNLAASLSYKGLTLQSLLASRRKSVPTAAFETIFNARHFRTIDRRKFVEIKYTRALGANKNLLARTHYNHYDEEGTYPDGFRFHEASFSHWLGSELQLRWDPRPDNRLTVGTEYQNHLRSAYLGRDVQTVYLDDNFPYNLLSFYAQDEYQVTHNLALTLGVRWDRYSNVGTARAPRAAMVYHPTRSSTLKLLYGEAFRAPLPWEIYTNTTIYKSNFSLQPERIKTAEAVWEQRLTPTMFGTVSLYNYRMRDLIDPVIDPADSLTQLRNVGRAKAYGMEVELKARYQTGLQGFVSYTYQNARDSKTDLMLTNSPRRLVKAGIIYPATKYVHAALEAQYESERITVYDTRTAPFLLTNLRLATAPNFGLKSFNIAFAINNLLDATYQTPGGVEHLQPAITQNRRNYALKLQYKL